MAGPDVEPGTKKAVIPALYSARAAETVCPVVLCNTADEDRWLDSGPWSASGLAQNHHASGLQVHQLTREIS